MKKNGIVSLSFIILLNILLILWCDNDLILINFLLIITGTLSLLDFSNMLLKQSISVSLVISFFLYVFFFIVPVIHLKYNYYNYFFDTNSIQEYFETSILAILFFQVIFYYRKSRVIKDNYWVLRLSNSNENLKQLSNYGFIIILIVSLILIARFGILSIIFRGNFSSFSSGDSQIGSLLFNYFFRPFLFFLFVLEYKKKAVKSFNLINWDIRVYILFVLMLIFNFPTGTARFYFLFIVITSLSVFFTARQRISYLLPILLIVGINFSFFFSSFRAVKNLSDFELNNFTLTPRSFIDEIHFDAFEVSILTLRYVDKFDYIYGKNIMGAILFFVPRQLWNDKPVKTGEIVLEKKINPKLLKDEDFDNISFPLISEFYISFGFIGVFGLAYFLSVFVRIIDSGLSYLFSLNKNCGLDVELNIALYSIFSGFFIFMMRGSLMSAFAYLVGIIFSFFLAMKVSKIKFRFVKGKIV